MPLPPAMPVPRSVESTDDVSLATYDFSGSGRDVLLVHANGFCAAVFAPLALALAPWRCAAFDARAHGGSGVPSGDMAWDGHRDDVLAVHRRDGSRSSHRHWALDGRCRPPARRAGPTRNVQCLVALRAHRLPTDHRSRRAQSARVRRATTQGSIRQCRRCFRPLPIQGAAQRAERRVPGCLRAPWVRTVTRRWHLAALPPRERGCRLSDGDPTRSVGLSGHGELPRRGRTRCGHCPRPGVRGARDRGRLAHGRLEEHPELGHFGPLAEPEVAARSIQALAAGL